MNNLLKTCLEFKLTRNKNEFIEFEGKRYHNGLVRLVKLLYKQKVFFTYQITKTDLIVNISNGKFTFYSYSSSND